MVFICGRMKRGMFGDVVVVVGWLKATVCSVFLCLFESCFEKREKNCVCVC